MTAPGATRALAAWAVDLESAAVPAIVRHEAKRALLDHLGVALAGSSDPGVDSLLRVVADTESAPQAAILGRAERVAVPFAALVNGYASHVLDYDDTYNPGRTTVHGSAPVWPAVLALAERQATSGVEALTAFVIGFETEVRIARAAGPAHYDVGWHVTGTVGHFGAAAAAARLIGLNVDRTVAALGTAGTQAAGLKQVYGSMGKALHPGKAAMDGVLSAQLAHEGFTSTDAIVEGPKGFLQVLSTDADPSELDDGLGEAWFLPENGYKLSACGSLMHPVIDAIIDLRRSHDLDPAEVVGIEATVHPNVARVTGIENPVSGLQGKFSIFHAASVAVLDGAAHLAQFTDDRVMDPEVVAMRGRVAIEVDEALTKQGARVALVLADGRRLAASVAHNRGTPANPVGDEDLTEKFLSLAGPIIGPEPARAASELVWAFDALNDLRPLLSLLAGETT